MPKLVITDGPDAGRELLLEGGEQIVGRGETATLQLLDLTVSREHFRLAPDGGGWRLLDQGSRNRTLVNGKPALSHFLVDGDRITIGGTLITYVTDHVFPGLGRLDLLPAGLEHVTVELSGIAAGARDAGRLAALYAFTEQVSEAARLDELYPRVASRTREETRADRVFLYILDRSGELMCAAGEGVEGVDTERVLISGAVIDKVMQEGKSVVAADTLEDFRFAQRDSIVNNAIRSLMCAPVMSRGRCLGLLYADTRHKAAAFNDGDLRFLTALAQQAGVAIDNLILRDALLIENATLRNEVAARHDLVGESEAIDEVLRFVQKVARTDSTIMLNGESGTGKELVARAVHHASPRGNSAFVAVNCAALTETLLESELFGHEKGAFTGATAQSRGRFEVADGGTLFLDEVGELSLSCQTRFLRVLEEGCFERVGSTRTVHTDVRVLAATNRDLSHMVAEGTFRADLFYRLQVIQIVLPPLRARGDDVALLVEHFVRRYQAKVGRRIEVIEPAVLEAVRAHRWPGNVRELKNAVERAMVLGEGPVLRAEDLPPSVLAASEATRPPSAAPPEWTEPLTIRDAELRAIRLALDHTAGNKARAAGVLGIDRSTLYKKIKDYGIDS